MKIYNQCIKSVSLIGLVALLIGCGSTLPENTSEEVSRGAGVDTLQPSTQTDSTAEAPSPKVEVQKPEVDEAALEARREMARLQVEGLGRGGAQGSALGSASYGPLPAPPADYMVFDSACSMGDTLTIAAVGDILVHTPLQKQATYQPDRFRSLWTGIVSLLSRADMTYGNFEGVSAPLINRKQMKVKKDPGFRYDDVVYTGYPRFNYHPFLIEDLVTDGFDIVSTANNHAADRGGIGVDLTIEGLNHAGLAGAGTRHSNATEETPWYAVVEREGWRVAWVACTKHTNGMRAKGQVLPCYKKFGPDSVDTNPDVVSLVASLAERDDIDAIMVTPHFGKSHKPKPNAGQKAFAHAVLEAGALAVVGSHVHNLQPSERYITADGRETFVLYSMGNFVSAQGGLVPSSTVILYLGLTRRSADQRVVLNGVRFLPLYMTRSNKLRQILPVDALGERQRKAVTKHITGIFGERNLIWTEEPFTTQPHCDRAWLEAQNTSAPPEE